MQEDISGKGPIRVVLLADNYTLFRQEPAGLLASHGGIEIVEQTEKRPRGYCSGLQVQFQRGKYASTNATTARVKSWSPSCRGVSKTAVFDTPCVCICTASLSSVKL
jgi:hypothetical protein